MSGVALDLRVLTAGDTSPVGHMRCDVLGWDRRPGYVRRALTAGHGVGAFDQGGLVGFRYQHALTPDVLGDGLILVHPRWRGRGVGRVLVEEFEHTAPASFHLSVVLNTDLLHSATTKQDATGFWQACGYELVASTPGSRLLVRRLVPATARASSS